MRATQVTRTPQTSPTRLQPARCGSMLSGGRAQDMLQEVLCTGLNHGHSSDYSSTPNSHHLHPPIHPPHRRRRRSWRWRAWPWRWLRCTGLHSRCWRCPSRRRWGSACPIWGAPMLRCCWDTCWARWGSWESMGGRAAWLEEGGQPGSCSAALHQAPAARGCTPWVRCSNPSASIRCLLPCPPTQIPAGLLADRIGGAHLAAAGLFTWSAACLLFARVPAAANPMAALLVARAALGLAQSCLMPAASALAGEREGQAGGYSVCSRLLSICPWIAGIHTDHPPALPNLPFPQPAGSLLPHAAGRPAPSTQPTQWARWQGWP